MKRIIALLVITGAMLVPTGVAQAQRQVDCRYTSHRITCYNNTQYQVWVKVVARTSAGRKTFYRVIRFNKISIYVPATIYSMWYRWGWN